MSHLYASFRQVNGERQPLSHAHVWVLGLLEGFLQRLQLWHGEGGAAAPLFLLVAIPSLQNKLWQETHTVSSPKQIHHQCCRIFKWRLLSKYGIFIEFCSFWVNKLCLKILVILQTRSIFYFFFCFSRFDCSFCAALCCWSPAGFGVTWVRSNAAYLPASPPRRGCALRGCLPSRRGTAPPSGGAGPAAWRSRRGRDTQPWPMDRRNLRSSY